MRADERESQVTLELIQQCTYLASAVLLAAFWRSGGTHTNVSNETTHEALSLWHIISLSPYFPPNVLLISVSSWIRTPRAIVLETVGYNSA